jgi:hypothetical protein
MSKQEEIALEMNEWLDQKFLEKDTKIENLENELLQEIKEKKQAQQLAEVQAQEVHKAQQLAEVQAQEIEKLRQQLAQLNP